MGAKARPARFGERVDQVERVEGGSVDLGRVSVELSAHGIECDRRHDSGRALEGAARIDVDRDRADCRARRGVDRDELVEVFAFRNPDAPERSGSGTRIAREITDLVVADRSDGRRRTGRLVHVEERRCAVVVCRVEFERDERRSARSAVASPETDRDESESEQCERPRLGEGQPDRR